MHRDGMLKVLFLGSALLLARSTAWPQQATKSDAIPNVRVEVQRSHMVLQVLSPVSLRTGLEAFCAKSEASCDIAPQMPDELLAPMVLQGTASEVLDKLLAGAKLNYTWLPPGLNQTGKLIVTLATQLPDTHSVATVNPSSAYAEAPQPVQVAVTPAPASDEPSGNVDSQSSEASLGSETPFTLPSGPTEVPAGMQATPFFGRRGSATLTSAANTSEASTPFIDSRGNLIPMPATGRADAFTPFFDRNGNPMPLPASNGSQESQLPFIDRNGQLIPSAAVQSR